ncbi:MAG: hypothetical protein VX899_15700 [Myxococcota bacterium]|nr:hypothetical protein [Myxococcota bacterium]
MHAMSANELQSILVFDQDRHHRALAHLHLGRLAMEQERRELATRHFREALVLDGRLDRARRFLEDLGPQPRRLSFQARLRRVFGRLKH